MELNLDAARAARDEVRGEAPKVIFGGETFTLPAELPMDYVWTLGEDDMATLKTLFNGQLDRFKALKPTREDLLALIAGVPKLYGLASEGESSASAGSSADGSPRSRPTSAATTKSTSAKRVGATSR